MGLSCLHAVQQAYKDRERAEVTAAKMSFVLHQKELRQAAKQRIRLYQVGTGMRMGMGMGMRTRMDIRKGTGITEALKHY